MSFKKRFGQHFLKDTGVLDRIIRLIHPQETDCILEIGAGDGALSTRFALRVKALLAVEMDPDWLAVLERRLSGYPGAQVQAGDILEMDLQGLLKPFVGHAVLRAAGNLPYNIATAAIERLISLRLPFEDMTFMVQYEVARRIVAAPGSRDYGQLSAYCQHVSEVSLAFTVSPACFVPRPKVKSAVVVFRPHQRRWETALERRFLSVLKAAFAYRRKTIANSLGRDPVLGAISGTLLERAGIEGMRRAEELAVEEFENLARALASMGSDQDAGK
ncbi:MAG: ribosomal RNA small subunit methyltransferase A [Acidobacteria bacterium]|nr:ribosomal RNA small subunit methyltransferase A [Acidobacteriota bacterium]